MSNHIKYLKSMVEQPVEVAKKEVEASGNRHSVKRRSSFGLKTTIALEGKVIQVLEETVKNPATAQEILVDKIYAFTPQGGDYCQLGWIHRAAISRCMVCNLKFGLMGKKYNCAACGYVICGKCSPQSAMIAELKSEERFRVCKRCFTGAKKLYALPHLRTDLSSPRSNNSMIDHDADHDLGTIEEKESDSGTVCQVTMDFIISTLEEEAVNPELAAAREVLQKITLLNPQQLHEFERFLSRDNSISSTTAGEVVGSLDEFGTALYASSPRPPDGRSSAALRFVNALKNTPVNNRSLYAIDSSLAISADYNNHDPSSAASLPRPLSTAALMSPNELKLLESFFGRDDSASATAAVEVETTGGKGKKKKGKKDSKGNKKDKTATHEECQAGEGGVAINSDGDKATKAAEKKARMRKALKKIANANIAANTLATGGHQSKATPVGSKSPVAASATAEFDDISVLSGDSSSPRASVSRGVNMSREHSVRSSNMSRQGSKTVMTPRETAISILSRDDTDKDIKGLKIDDMEDESMDADNDEDETDDDSDEDDDEDDDETKSVEAVPIVVAEEQPTKTGNPVFCSVESCIIS